MRRYLIIAIWILSIAVNFVTFLASLFKMKEFYYNSSLVKLHCFCTFPVVGIIFMYGLLLWTIQKKRRLHIETCRGIETLNPEDNNRRRIFIVTRLVIFLLISYLPYLGEQHYFFETIAKRASGEITWKVMLYKLEIYFSKFQHIYFSLYR